MNRMGLMICAIAILSLTFLESVRSEEKEVLVRDRLVLLLCDQMQDYMQSGRFPPPVKSMPDKYKKVKPGSPDGAVPVPNQGINGRGGNRLKRHHAVTVLDFMDA